MGFCKAGVVAAAVVFMWNTGAMAQQAQLHRFSVKDAVDYAAKNNAQVKNALLDYKIQEQTNRSITSQALPQVNGSAGGTDNLIIPTSLIPAFLFDQTAPPDKFVPVKFSTRYSSSFGVSLSQILFDGQVFVGLKARQTALNFYSKNAELTEQTIRVNVFKVYYQLLLSSTQIDLIDANIKRAEELLHNTKAMFENGFAEQLDVDKASVQLSNLQSQKVETQFIIDKGFLGLKMLLGMPIADSLILTDTLTYDMVRNVSLSDQDYKYTDRRDFQLLSINRQLNEFDIMRYRKMYIPSVTFSMYYGKSRYGDNFKIFDSNWYPASYLSLNINVPIFDGFYKDANIKKSKLTLEQTQNKMEALKISIDNDVKEAQLRFASAMATLNVQKQNMDLATNVYEQTRKKYEQGIGSNTEITSAQTDLQQAQTNYFTALYNTVVAKIDYQNAIGKL